MKCTTMILTATALCLTALGGCGKDKPEHPPASPPAATKAAATLPDIPGLDEGAVVADGPLVTSRPSRHRKDGYRFD